MGSIYDNRILFVQRGTNMLYYISEKFVNSELCFGGVVGDVQQPAQ
jgi:hypothetical protein